MYFAVDAVGVDITMYSAHGEEKELLILPGCELRVTDSRVERGPGSEDMIFKYDLYVAEQEQNLDFVQLGLFY